MAKNTLCIDIGTKTGYATLLEGQPITSGTEFLASELELQAQRENGEERTGDIRFKRLHAFIYKTIKQHDIQRIVFEDVIFATSQIQAQLWASLRAIIWNAGITNNVEVQCVPVGTLKIFGAGTGKADKQQMSESLQIKHPEAWKATADDNEIDAVWIAFYTAAVDKGLVNWSSVWENRKKRKLEKQQKAKAKREVAKTKKAAIIATSIEDLTAALLQANIKVPKGKIIQIAKMPIIKKELQNVTYVLDSSASCDYARTIIAECSKNKIIWRIEA